MTSLCSPIPPVKTIASTPLSAAANEPTYFLMRYPAAVIAMVAFSSPAFILGSRSRISELKSPLRPYIPHFLLRYVTISPISLPSFLPRYSTAPASMSPERVPMITPSRGVKPIVVSTHLPAFTADKLLPLPRWQTMIFALGLPRYFATSVETNLWLVPWKPYLRTLNFS